MNKKFKVFLQHNEMDCGPTCLRMISYYYGKYFSQENMIRKTLATKQGVSIKDLNEAALNLGFKTLGVKLNFDQLLYKVPLPCIIYWNKNHFVVIPPQKKNIFKKDTVEIADPSKGLIKKEKKDFLNSWLQNDEKGIALLIEPTSHFYEIENDIQEKSLNFFLEYLKPYKKYITQIFLGMIVGSVLSLITPLLTQSLIDNGVNLRNINFINLILLAQISIFVGESAIEIIRGWLILHMSSRVSITIISDFLNKLMKLPMKFFDTKRVGDINQRISDQSRIEQFLTGSSLSTLFSLVNLISFSIVLSLYSEKILLIFIFGSITSVIWIILFMNKRKKIDNERFSQLGINQSKIFEIVTGMQEIKMNDAENVQRSAWEKNQVKLFKLNIKSLSIVQYQTIGSNLITQLKNIFITYTSAASVISGDISIGMMLSISYIAGQMNSPINQLLTFFQNAQDAQLSTKRLKEIYDIPNEDSTSLMKVDKKYFSNLRQASNHEIAIENLNFGYDGNNDVLVLSNVNLKIPFGKVTAIVGTSGSGKTTLMKLLLKFYEVTDGNVYIGNISLRQISPKWWRDTCAAVMADGYIFSGTILQNIVIKDDYDQDGLHEAIRIANLKSFIDSLPLGLSTNIGITGSGLSSGQKQRILIARAIYRSPEILFLDEATSTLDANNEKIIVDNLAEFFKNRTVIVIAHRLSTVKNADQIIVMDSGKVVETGNHNSLINMKSYYYNLIKNQLELGS